MRAVAHGWRPDRVKAPPQRVAREFAEADQRRRRRRETLRALRP